VPRDFLSLLSRPADLLKALRKIAIGSVIATTGVSATPPTAAAAESPGKVPAQGLTPTIVDRSRKAAKLVLQLPGTTGFLNAEHRSHRSHSSHRSHYSSSGGGGTPSPPTTRPRTTPTPESPSTLDLNDPTAVRTLSGVVVGVDRLSRTITVRDTANLASVFAYRDDSKVETSVGVTVRFDDFADANPGQFPVALRDKVRMTWRTSPDGNARIVNTIKKTP
jgi:hypothetical protein